MSAGPGLRTALAGGLLLGLATPPAAVPFGEWLMLPALAVWFALATTGRRPALHSYLFGCVHMAWFSWSVRHVLLPAYVAIVVLGGLYYLLATLCVRRLSPAVRSVGFGAAVAGSFWLRAVMPEIHYPHGQPCHALYQWPSLLRTVAVGGEPLLNALLAWVAAAGFELWQSWRTASPGWSVARRRLLASLLVAIGAALAGNAIVFSAADRGAGPDVRLLLVEPGLRPDDMLQVAPGQWRAWVAQFEAERLQGPTREALARTSGVDLVVWPESSVQGSLSEERLAAGGGAVRIGRQSATDARLLLGANLRRGDGRTTPAAFLVELPTGEVVGYQAKQRLVPGGEFLPLLGLLPDAWSSGLAEMFRAALGVLPDCVPGGVRPPLETAGGAPFGALLCYDNAFPGPAAAQVERGATFLVVLSNEAWYRGGGELQQLVAMTAVRACENAVPIARCTMDGWTVWVDAQGRLAGALALDHGSPEGRARVQPVTLQPGAGKPPILGWLRQAMGPGCGLAALLGAAWGWAARRRRRSSLLQA